MADHKTEPMYKLEDFRLDVPGGRIDLVIHPANGESALSIKSRGGLIQNDDGSFSTASEGDVDHREIDVSSAVALLTAKCVFTNVSKMISLGSELARSTRSHLPMIVGALRQIDEMTGGMINDFEEVSGNGALDPLIRAQFLKLADVLMALAEGREPVMRSVDADGAGGDVEKAGRVMSRAMLSRMLGMAKEFVKLAIDNGASGEQLQMALGEFVPVQQSSEQTGVSELAQLCLELSTKVDTIEKRLGELGEGVSSDALAREVEKAVETRVSTLPGSGVAPDDADLHVERSNDMTVRKDAPLKFTISTRTN